MARVAVPKIIALRVEHRHPVPGAVRRRWARCCWPGCPPTSWTRCWPSRRGPASPPGTPDRAELDGLLRDVRAKGWALTDEALAPGIRSVAAPLRDGAGRVFAAMNVTVHAAETSVATLTGDYLPLLLQAAGEVSADFARRQSVPVAQTAG